MKKEHYKKLYLVNDVESVSDYMNTNHFVWCNSNWDYIYKQKPRTCECEILEDYTLVFFESNEEYEEYFKKYDLENINIQDVSFEFDFPSILTETTNLSKIGL